MAARRLCLVGLEMTVMLWKWLFFSKKGQVYDRGETTKINSLSSPPFKKIEL